MSCRIPIGWFYSWSLYDREATLTLTTELPSMRYSKDFENLESTYERFGKANFLKNSFVIERQALFGGWPTPERKVVSSLYDKVCEDEKGPNILDEDGKGLLHLVAALGFDCCWS